MQKELVIQFYKTINKLLCNLSFTGQYTKNGSEQNNSKAASSANVIAN